MRPAAPVPLQSQLGTISQELQSVTTAENVHENEAINRASSELSWLSTPSFTGEDEDTPNDEATNLSQHNTGDSPDTFHILSRLSTPSYTGEDDPDYGTLSSAQSDAFNHSEDAFSDDSRLSTPFYTGEDGPDYGTPNSAQTDFSNHSRDVSPDSRSPYLPTLGRTTPSTGLSTCLSMTTTLS
ncbi:hypothetical protein SEUCBS140593_003483 [Sporothrix eucalyptigena]|uniref:Uncharacterized protein n=1 Tax=Sporothrix eucalyptigena TaxID=1812306 RepID=A0ABP0BFG1_9PEZI